MRTVSVGNQGFAFAREHDCFYIDKTLFIKEWWQSSDIVTLITRPRRFGKTFNLSMLECFFSSRYKNRSDLFEGLSIWKEEAFHKLQGTYPVISMSFGSIKERDFENAKGAMIFAVSRVYSQHSYLKQSEALTEEEQRDFVRLANYSSTQKEHVDDQTIKNSILKLSEYLERHHGKKVIILLDEYDTPMQEAYVAGYWEEIVSFLRGMFNVTFKDNVHLERAIMTGITRVSKESIFSDLNHLNVVTTTCIQYATCFGFTEEEVFAALDETGIPEEKEDVKAWYDGFTFGGITDIYNPWSISNFLKFKEYKPYWAETSSNELVSQLIQTGDIEVKDTIRRLMQGEALTTKIDEQIVFKNLEEGENSIWSLFLASGYLKVLGRTFDKEEGTYTYELGLTNMEVHLMFRKLILRWFAEPCGNYNKFSKALLRGNVEDMNYYLQETVDCTISSFDVGGKVQRSLEERAALLAKGQLSLEEFLQEQKENEHKYLPENFYHALVLGLIVDLRSHYQVKSNRESGRGRYDVILIPKEINKENTPAIIIEFKLFDGKRETDLEDTVSRALAQIEEKKYDTELVDMGMEEAYIKKYGFAFRGKEVLIGES